jgi:hypothetical protein
MYSSRATRQGGSHVKLRRLMALVMSIALTSASYPHGGVAAQAAQAGAPSPQAIQATGSVISGTVLRSDRKTPAADICLRLRHVDANAVVARTTTDRNGAFSFAVAERGMYLVEAIDCNDAGVLAVSGAVNFAGLPTTLTTLVVLPSTALVAGFLSSTAFLVLSAASAAAITAVAVRADSPAVSSPEQ